MVASILAESEKTYVTKGNYNSEIGLPLSVFGLRKEHVFGVFELGSNHPGEIAMLADILRPNIALVTNVGTAHIGMFGSREAVADEKGSVFSSFDASSRGIVWEDEIFAGRMIADKRGTFRFFGPSSTAGVESVESLGLLGGRITYKGNQIKLALPGYHNLINACAAISVAQMCGACDKAVVDGLEKMKPSFGRGELVSGEISVLQDCYNANLESLFSGLAVINDTGWKNGRIIGVLGAMKELGDYSAVLHEEAGRICAESGFYAWFFFGGESKAAYAAYLKQCDAPGYLYEDFNALSERLQDFLLAGDLVYLKGSRSTGLERLTADITAVRKGGSRA